MKQNHWKKLLCLALVMTMLLSMSAVFAAEYDPDNIYDQTENKNVPKVDTFLNYDAYTVLGDSIAAGFGDYDYTDDDGVFHPDSAYHVFDPAQNYTYSGYRAIDKVYHSIIAKSVGAKKLYPLAYSGTRSVELRAQLEKGYVGDDMLFKWLQVNNYTVREDGSIDYYTADPNTPADWNHRSWEFMNSHIREAVQDSQLVTINVGSNDILTFPFTYTIELLYRKDDSKLTAFMKKLMKCEDYPEMMDTFFQTANTLNNVQEMLTKMLGLMVNGYRQYFENMMPIVEHVKEMNPNAKIAVIGMYNPLAKMRFSDDSSFKVGQLAAVLIPAINNYLAANADRMGYTYVDVVGTEVQDIPALSEGFETVLGRILYDVHPNFDGHYFMAEKILGALEDAEIESRLPYVDVNSKTAYLSDIQYCYDNKLISGTSLRTFSPYMNMTRGMFVASMYALGNKKVNMNTGSSFGTILKSSYFTKALAWAYSNGITFGVNKSLFSPLTRVTREQMAQMLYQYAGKPELETDADLTGSYADTSKVSSSCKDAVLWAAAKGIINPVDGILNPKASVTRGEMAHALHVYAKLEK